MRILNIDAVCYKLSKLQNKGLQAFPHVRLILLYLLFFHDVNVNASQLTRIVHTRYGKMQGIVKPATSGKHLKPVEIFLGVPYATSPTGTNRFSPTRALTPWEGIKVFNTFGPVCPQWLPDIGNETDALERMPKGRLEHLKRLLPFLRNQSEDCLHLNIYAPAQGNAEKIESKYPVIVYIHGESYSWNSGNPYDGRILASYTDLIVVTLNYRLGVLGFLNTNSEPNQKARVANYGLMDQIAALHWIHENIARFGGDPTNVTLMGHGTGAACINFLMISPAVMPGLFHRAILLSGSAMSNWALVEEPVVYSLEIARQVNCTSSTEDFHNQEHVIDCLRQVPIADLMKTSVIAPTFLNAFGPSIDGVVIKSNFQDEMLASILPEWQNSKSITMYGHSKERDLKLLINANKYDLLFGCVTSEALWRFSHNDIQSGFEGDRRDRILRTYIRNTYNYHLSEIFFTVVNEYTDWERTVLHPINTRDSTIAALSDAQFVAPIVQTGDLFSKLPSHTASTSSISSNRLPSHPARVFFYVFDYQTKDGDYPQRMGAVHGEELSYMFGAPLTESLGYFPRNFTKPEITLAEAFMIYLGNFARMGNPNDFQKQEATLVVSKERNRFRGITWEEYDPIHQKYLEIGMKPRVKNHFRAHQLSVWLRLIPELHRAGMEDVNLRHNMFRNYEGELYDGIVKNERHTQQNSNSRRSFVYNDTVPVAEIFQSITTLEPFLITCVNVAPALANSIDGVSYGNATDTILSVESQSLVSYSTTLGLTIAIGCTLLVLNIVIFAGVYYQRDKTRLEIKSLREQRLQQQSDGSSGSPFGSSKNTISMSPMRTTTISSHPGSVILDLEPDMSLTKLKTEATLPRPVQYVHKYPSSNLCSAGVTLPRHMQSMKAHITNNDQLTTLDGRSLHSFSDRYSYFLNAPSNGCCVMPASSPTMKVLPKPPPPPTSSPPLESQPLLHSALTINPSQSHNKTVGILRVPAAAISEMRV